jgi:hypothetical protein
VVWCVVCCVMCCVVCEWYLVAILSGRQVFDVLSQSVLLVLMTLQIFYLCRYHIHILVRLALYIRPYCS